MSNVRENIVENIDESVEFPGINTFITQCMIS